MTGRKIIIVIVVLTSALSFTLGYFVGKAVLKEERPQPQAITDFSQPDAAPNLQEQPARPVEQTAANNLQPPAKEANLPPDKGKVPIQTIAVKEEKIKPVTKESRPPQDDIAYTVQVGAFKNPTDAAALKRKLEARGYRVYIKKSVEAKHTKLFKVRIGEFTDKEQAEAFALKIKKNEGLKDALAVPKNETAREEDKSSSSPRSTKQEKPR